MKSYLPATVLQDSLDVEEDSVSQSYVSNLPNLDGGKPIDRAKTQLVVLEERLLCKAGLDCSFRCRVNDD